MLQYTKHNFHQKQQITLQEFPDEDVEVGKGQALNRMLAREVRLELLMFTKTDAGLNPTTIAQGEHLQNPRMAVSAVHIWAMQDKRLTATFMITHKRLWNYGKQGEQDRPQLNPFHRWELGQA